MAKNISKKKRLKKLLIAMQVALMFAPALAGAATGVTVSPPFQDLTIKQGQANASFVYSITNNDQQIKTFNVGLADFGSLDEAGGVAFLGTGAGDLSSHTYGLINWMRVEPTQVTLGAGQTAKLTVTVDNKDTLAPGGHYGAVLLSQLGPQAPGDKVLVQSIVSTLVFVSKLGGEKYGLRLESVQKDSHWWQTFQLKLRFQNTGNIHVVPRGTVRLIDPLGREVARTAFNEGSARILPGTYRTFGVGLLKTRKFTLPGRYQLRVDYRYDGQPSFTSYHTNLFFIDLQGGLIALALLAVIVGGGMILVRLLKKR